MEDNDKKKNPLIQGDHSSIAVKDLHNNVDNHTDSHDVVSNTTNNNTVNQNSTVVYNGVAASEKLLSERREEYRIFCEKNIVSRIISRNTRLELNEKASRLQLDSSITEEIEHTVMMRLETGTLSNADRVTLNVAIKAICNDSGKDIVDKLVVLANKTEDEEVQFYANLALAVYDSRRCVQRYEQKAFDSYWQTFWTYFAYKRNGNNPKAEMILTHLSAWSDYPEDQITLLSGAGYLYDYFAANGTENMKKTALEYLNNCATFSQLLSNFVSALQYLALANRPLYFGNDNSIKLYLKLFGAKERPAVDIAPKSFSCPDNTFNTRQTSKEQSVYELANQIYTASSGTPAMNSITTSSHSSEPSYLNNTSHATDKKKSINLTSIIIGGLVIIGGLYLLLHTGNTENQDVIQDGNNIENVQNDASSILNDNKTLENESSSRGSTSNKTKDNIRGKNSDQITYSKKSSHNKDDMTESTSLTDQPTIYKSEPALEPTKPKESDLEKLQKAVTSGDMTAACKLGQMYLDGDGVKKSNKTAFQYFQQAANAGNADGMYWTGWCYRMGRGTKKNLDQAKAWWTKAAAAGHIQAMEDVKQFDTLM